MKLKEILSLIIIAALLACSSSADQSATEGEAVEGTEKTGSAGSSTKVKKLWESAAELQTPESVIYDADNDRIIVSNIVGDMMDYDGDGFLSVLNMKGEIETLRWIDGLNAPKGMAIMKGHLYVSDLNELVKIDLTSGTVVSKYKGDRAIFLNDVAAHRNQVYVSDMRTGAIWTLVGESFSIWMDWQSFQNPNGLYAEEEWLVVGGESGSLQKIRYDQFVVESHIENSGSVDGLEKAGDGYLTSDWYGTINYITADSKQVLLTPEDDGNQKADIDFIAEKNLLLIATFHGNSVTAYELNF